VKRATTDLLAVIGIVAATFAGAVWFDLHEAFSGWAEGYERWQVDEMPAPLLALVVGVAWFALRRWRDARVEIERRLLAEQRIAELLARNRDLTRELIAAQENERRALARELHDELGQMCNAIHVEAAYIARLTDRQQAAARASAGRIAAIVEQLYQLVRGMLRRLRPAALDNLGLVPAIEDLCEGWAARSGIVCRFTAESSPDTVDDAAAIALYRTVQEALSNVARHSSASRVEVRLRHEACAGPAQSMQNLILTIDDDGCGMEHAAPRSGLGLLGMQERVAALGGALALDTAPGQGLRLRVAIPAA